MNKYKKIGVISIIICIVFTTVAWGNNDGNILKLSHLSSLTGHALGLNNMEFNSTGNLLLSSGKKGDVFLWNIETGTGKKIIEYNGINREAIFSKDDKYIITSGDYGYIDGWMINIQDTNTGQILDSVRLYADEGSHSQYIDKIDLPATALEISLDSKTLIIGCNEQGFNSFSSIRYYDIESKREISKFNVDGVIELMEYHPTKDVYAYISSYISSGEYAALTVRDKNTNRILMSSQDKLNLSSSSRYDLKFSPDGKYMAVVSYQRDEAQLLIFDTENNYQQVFSDTMYGQVYPMSGKISFSDKDKLLVVGDKLYFYGKGFIKLDEEIGTSIHGQNDIGILSPTTEYMAITNGSQINIYRSEIANLVDKPKNLIAKSLDQQVQLTWESVKNTNNLVGYYLYRAKESNRYNPIPVTDFPIKETNYIDKNVNNDEVYYYTVKAVYNDGSQSESSNEVSVVPKRGNQNIMIEIQVGNPIMKVNGIASQIDPGVGTTPLIINGRTTIPIRSVIEAMQGQVFWNPEEEKISISVDNNYIDLWINKKEIIVNSQLNEIDVAPQIINGRTMLPLRFVVENLGYEIEWNAQSQTAIISK